MYVARFITAIATATLAPRWRMLAGRSVDVTRASLILGVPRSGSVRSVGIGRVAVSGEPGQRPQPQPEQHLDAEVAQRTTAARRSIASGRSDVGRARSNVARLPTRPAYRRRRDGQRRGAAARASRRPSRSCRAPAGGRRVAAGPPSAGRARVLSTSCLPSTKTRSTGPTPACPARRALRSATCSTRSRTCGPGEVRPRRPPGRRAAEHPARLERVDRDHGDVGPGQRQGQRSTGPGATRSRRRCAPGGDGLEQTRRRGSASHRGLVRASSHAADTGRCPRFRRRTPS